MLVAPENWSQLSLPDKYGSRSHFEKKKLEELLLTGRIEGKRVRGRQRMTFLGWLYRTTGVKPLELITMLKERRKKEAVTAVYARALA